MSAKLSVITGSILLLSAPLQGFSATTHPDSCMNRDWKKEIPLPVYPNREMVDLYHKTWEIAAGRVRKGPEGLPASPYMDENCYEDTNMDMGYLFHGSFRQVCSQVVSRS